MLKVSCYAVLRNIYDDRLTCWAGLVCSDGLKNSIAPNSLARGRVQCTCLQPHSKLYYTRIPHPLIFVCIYTYIKVHVPYFLKSHWPRNVAAHFRQLATLKILPHGKGSTMLDMHTLKYSLKFLRLKIFMHFVDFVSLSMGAKIFSHKI